MSGGSSANNSWTILTPEVLRSVKSIGICEVTVHDLNETVLLLKKKSPSPS